MLAADSLRIVRSRAVLFDAALEDEITKLRATVDAQGGVTVGCNQLRILCPDQFTAPQQFARVAEIAQRENWSFAFFADGSVRFGSYVKYQPRDAEIS